MQSNTRWILIASFTITFLIFIGVMANGLVQFEDVKEQSGNIVEKNNIKSQLIFAMLSSARERVVDLYAMVNTDDPFIRDDLFLDFNKQGSIFARSRMKLLKGDLSESEQAIITKQGKLTGYSVPIQNKLIELIQAENLEEAKTLLNEEGLEAQNKVLEQLMLLLGLQQQHSQDILLTINNKFERSRRLTLSWALLAIIFGSIVVIFVLRKITRIEHLLFDENENTRATLISISDAIIRIDCKNEIIFSNRKANDIFGYSILGKK